MNIGERVLQFIVTHYYVPHPGKIAEGTSLLREGVVDSAGILELISFLEEAFEIQISDEDLLPENLDSVRQIEAFVKRKQGL